MALLEVTNLGIAFGGLQAVEKFALSIEKGHLYGLIGPNGAGKTTVFNMLTGVYQPTEGDIVLDGKSIVGLKPAVINKAGIARTFQNIRLFKDMTVLDNVKVGLHNQVKYTTATGILRLPSYFVKERAMNEKAMELLKIFDLDGEAGQPASSLPYGKQRKLEIARALATNPKLLLLDEHTAALDPATTAAIHRLLREMNDGGTTIFLTTHNMEEADRLCARVAFLNEGRIAETGVPAQLKLKYAKDRVRVLLEDGEALECARNPEAIGALLADLSGRGIASVHSEEPDLEEIFLQVTGRNLV